MNLPSLSARAQRVVVGIWALIAIAALPFAARVNDQLDAWRPAGDSESSRVEAALQQQFESPFAKIALLRISSAPDPRTADGEALLKDVTDTIRRTAGVRGVMSYLGPPGFDVPRGGRSPILLVGLNAPKGTEDAVMTQLVTSTGALRAQLRGRNTRISPLAGPARRPSMRTFVGSARRRRAPRNGGSSRSPWCSCWSHFAV